MYPLTGNLAHQLGYELKYGIVVKNVRPGSAAEQAGLQRYDIVAKVDDKEIHEPNDMHRNIATRGAGETVDLTVYRDEGSKLAEKHFKVALAERPAQDELEKGLKEPKTPGKTPEKDLLGLHLIPAPDGKGVVVESVDAGGRAALAGIQKDDLVLQVNKQDVNNVQDVQKALHGQTSDSHLFYVERKGQSNFFMISGE
jgi:S1-C subfamily serine protease